MMNEMGLQRVIPDQSSGTGHTYGTSRHPSVIDPILSKRVCFYKSGDPQFNGLRMVINNRTFKTFDGLLDSLSKKVPLPFGVRNISTPRGIHAVCTLDELEDGKSYICSDRRKVKPINLALARKKLPPWYQARPVSSRRRTVQQARFFPGWSIHKQEPVVGRTPKRLQVFRNGDTTVKYTVVLQKRITPTFESILEYISDLIQFHVVKLHTLDGRRVDSLPGLILCSGTIVATGREPFKPANYNAQKAPPPTMPTTKRMSVRRLKRKKKTLSYSSKSRQFSPSSEMYIVNQIHNSITESSCDLPSNPTNSVDLDGGCVLESLAETEGNNCLDNGAGGQDCSLPTDDNIEKSFRVNQDGSMTVEMKVCLTIKEEETVHWTTTLTRSSVANQLNQTCLTEPEAEQEISSQESNSVKIQSPAASNDTINKDKTWDDNDQDPPSSCNGAFNESSNQEDDFNKQTGAVSPWRASSPGQKQITKKQTSVESIQSLSADGIQEGMVGSYCYREQTEYGAMAEQYCMVKQSSIRPVPKPRTLGSLDANNINSRNVSTFKSAGMTEIVHTESGGEEVTETFLHSYEQQTCRPATSGSGQLSSCNEFELDRCRPSTASESLSIWKTESRSFTSDITLPSLKTVAVQARNAQQHIPKHAKGKDKPLKREVNNDKKIPLKPKVITKRVRWLKTPGKRPKEKSAETGGKRRKVKTFSSAGFIRKIYGSKLNSTKTTIKRKKEPTQNGERGHVSKSSQQSDDECITKDTEIPSAVIEDANEIEKSKLNVGLNEVSQQRGILTRQTSMYQEKNNGNDVSKSMPLLAFNNPISATNEYVENWLAKSNPSPTDQPVVESKELVSDTLVQTENGRCWESENKNVAEEVNYSKETSEIQTCRSLKTDPQPPENVLGASVKQRIKSFEIQPINPSPSIDKAPVDQQNVHTTTTIKENNNSLAQNNIEKTKSFTNHICSGIYPSANNPSTEMPSGSDVENESRPINISLHEATPSDTLLMELPLPPPPPPVEYTELENTEYCMMDVSSVASSPLYRLSSESSQMSDNHPLSLSPTSDRAISTTDHTMEMTTSIQTDIPSVLGKAPLPRAASFKRTPLVSKISFDRKMSLRKACLDKYTLCSDATSETTTLSTHINKGGDNVLQNGICSTGIQQPSEIPPDEIQQANSILDLNSLAYCTSASPTIPTSEERTLSDSILSSKASTLSDLALTEPKTNESPVVIEKGASSPKPLIKKVKLMSSQSPERKSQTKKFSSELHHNSPKLSSSQNHIPDETMSPNIAMRRDETPNASPSTETKQTLYEPKLQERRSPYSQSLDIVSPSVKHKSSRKLLSRDLSSDNVTESTNGSPRKTLSERKRQQTPQSTKSTAELDKTLTSITLMSVKADQSDDIEVNKTDKLITDQEESMRGTQMPQPLNMANQPNMTPVLEEICFSIKSIRHISQNKRPSCLEKSNSMPDFSSHVASTFGSSTKTLLAFLSVMTLKASLTNPNMDQLNANNVSCAEALKMIDSLKEIARIEDSHELKDSLSKLQQSASTHLLQSWRGFQELSDTCKSRSSTPNDPEQELVNKAEKDCGIDENVIDEIMDNLGIPRKLKEELSSFSLGVKGDSDNKENMSGGTIVKISENSNNDITQDEKAYVDVSSIIKKFTDIDQPKQSSRGSITETVKHKTTDRANKDQDSQYVQKLTKCTLAESEERQLNSTVLLVKETEESMQSCSDTVNKENLRKEKQQSDSEDQSNQEKANMIAVSRIETQDSLTSEVDERDMEDQLLMNSEESMSIPENELNESRSEQEGKNMSSAFKDLEQKVNCGLSLSSSQAGEQLANSTEEDSEVECEEIHQESRESEELPISESQIEEKHDKQQSSNYFVELNSRETESISSSYSENKSLSEEEQLEVQFQELSNKYTLSKTASPSDLDREQQSQAVCTILKPEVDCEEIFQESRESDYICHPESQIEEQEEKQQNSTYFEKRNVNETERISSTDSLSKSSSEEELEVEFKELSSKEYSSILARLSHLEQEQQSQAVCKILKPEGECEEICQESDKSSISESQVEEEEDKKPSSNYFVKLNLRETESISSPYSENKSLSEEEQLEVQFQELSNKYTLSKTASPSDLDREQQSQAVCTILKPEVDCEEIFQESRESDYLSNPESQIEEQEEKQQSSTYFEERNVNETERISSTDSLSKSSSEEELEVEFKELNSKEYLSSLARLSHLEQEQQSQAVCKILKPDGECEEKCQESDKSSISESQVEKEEDKKTTSNYFVEFNSREKEGISSENKSLSEEEQLEVQFQELSNKDTLSENASPSYLDREQQNQAVCTILKVECEKIFQERRESEYLSNPESQIEEQEEKQQSSTYFAEIISSPDSLMKSSEEEELEVEFKELNRKEYLPNHARLTHLEQEQEQSPAGCMVLNVSVNDSTCNSDEEVHTIECKQPQVIHEERTKIHKVLKASIEETEEDKVSTDDEDHLAYKTHICDEIKSQNSVEGDLSNFIENQNSYTKKDSSHLIQSNSLSTHYEFNADEDSGNDHSSCEEHFEIEQIKVEDKEISHSIEEELNYDEREYSSDEEHAKMDRYIEEDCTEYQEALTTDCEVTNYDKAEENLKQQPENIISPSVAKRIILLEKQVADAQKINISTEKFTMRRFSQINVPLESDVEDTHSESQSALGNRSAPQSSLSFSYDSSNVITTEPEGNRVRSIREMFLAKCPTDIQHEHRCFPSPNASQLPELRAQTSVSAGYQSQTSSELSSGEDDSPRKTITKGFVRRTIERLYGKKDANPDEEASERPPSVMKPEKKEYSSIFSPFHTARSKAVSELSYFNSALALDTLSESARCLVFNSQVGPVNSALINNGEWLLKENTVIRKSVSDPVGINKTFTNSPQDKVMCEDAEECSPYSHFNTKSELEDKKKSFSGKCTYFSLPHASDSEPCQDELSTVSKSIADGDSFTDTKVNSEDTKMCEERNSMLPSGAITGFKMVDNKVHPLVKIPSDREVVDVQPGKGQGALNRRLGEPDMLDILYNFCGQNCPFL